MSLIPVFDRGERDVIVLIGCGIDDPLASVERIRPVGPERLDAYLILRDTLRHPDLSPFLRPDGDGPTLVVQVVALAVLAPPDLRERVRKTVEICPEPVSLEFVIETATVGSTPPT